MKINIVTHNINPRITTKNLDKDIEKYKNCDIACFQEVGGISQIKRYAKYLQNHNFHYHKRKKQYGKLDYLVTFTNLPIKSKGYFNIKVDNKLSGAALYTEFEKLIVFNCHFRVMNIGIEERITTFNKITKRYNRLYANKPCIILGDLNTVVPEKGKFKRIGNWLYNKSNYTDKSLDERTYFKSNLEKKGFKEITKQENTWVIPNTNIYYPYLKLDWFIVKNIKVYSYKLTPVIGDHHGILAAVEI